MSTNHPLPFCPRYAINSQMHKKYPPIGERERENIAKVLATGELWEPWGHFSCKLESVSCKLESEWADRIGVKYCAAVNSGTAALHCALFGCGVGPGDEVLVPAYTFIASASAVLMAGAIPMFVDIDADTGNLSLSEIDKWVTERTKAILVVHLNGMPADMDGVMDVAQRHDLLLVLEDCAQAHGAVYNGKCVGSFGTAAAFLLNATKVLAGPEGGLMTTDDEDVFNRAARLRTFGTEWRQGERLIRNTDCIGFNYRTNEFAAAFASARLESLDSEQQIRIANAECFLRGIEELSGVRVPQVPENMTHVYQMIRVELSARDAGVQCGDAEFRDRVLEALLMHGAFFFRWETKPLPEYELFQTKNATGGGVPWALPANCGDVEYDCKAFPASTMIGDRSLYTTSHFPSNDIALMEQHASAANPNRYGTRAKGDAGCRELAQFSRQVRGRGAAWAFTGRPVYVQRNGRANVRLK